MITRKVRRESPDLYWKVIETVYIEIQGQSKEDAAKHVKHRQEFFEYLWKKHDSKPYVGYMTPFHRECHLYSFCLDSRLCDYEIWENESAQIKHWYHLNFDLIAEIVERIFGRERMAKQPYRLWDYLGG